MKKSNKFKRRDKDLVKTVKKLIKLTEKDELIWVYETYKDVVFRQVLKTNSKLFIIKLSFRECSDTADYFELYIGNADFVVFDTDDHREIFNLCKKLRKLIVHKITNYLCDEDNVVDTPFYVGEYEVKEFLKF